MASLHDGRDGEPPHLVIFLHKLAATGVARNAVALANRLSARGWQVTVLTSVADGELTSQLVGPRHEALLKSAPLGRRAIQLARTLPHLRRWLRRERPDAFLSAGNHAHVVSLLATHGLDEIKTVVRISNDLTHGNDRDGGWVRRTLMRQIVTRADRVVLVSEALAREAVFCDTQVRKKVQIIPNGVAVETVRERALQPFDDPWLTDKVPYVIAIGRHSEQKNLERLVEAMPVVARKSAIKLLILGGSSDRRKSALQERVDALDLGDRVRLLEPVANPFPLLKGARALILPSLWEGASNVLLEGIACGVPVAASRTAGNAEEVLGHGEFGVLFDPLDIDAMAAAILRQCDPATQVPPGDRAAKFSLDATSSAYLALLENG